MIVDDSDVAGASPWSTRPGQRRKENLAAALDGALELFDARILSFDTEAARGACSTMANRISALCTRAGRPPTCATSFA